MLLYLIVLSLIFAVTAFGATYLLLRKTPYAPYSILLSLVFFQAASNCNSYFAGLPQTRTA